MRRSRATLTSSMLLDELSRSGVDESDLPLAFYCLLDN